MYKDNCEIATFLMHFYFNFSVAAPYSIFFFWTKENQVFKYI